MTEEIKAILQTLRSHQQDNGSFLSLSSPHPTDFTHSKTYHTIFIPSLILASLNQLDSTQQSTDISQRLATFLWHEQSKQGSWNYWSRSSQEFSRLACPDDLDDTFCALAALHRHDSDRFTGTLYGQLSQLLIATEQEPGGPYRTWLAAPNSDTNWLDIDPIVNSNIAYFLSLQSISLPKVINYIETEFDKTLPTLPTSAYYPSTYPLLASLSRWYTGSHVKTAINFLLEEQQANGHWSGQLNTALATTVLLRWNYPAEQLKPAIDWLKQLARTNQWQAEAYCLDPAINKQRHYAGSPALTAAFALEALALWQQKHTTAIITTDQPELKFHNTITERVQQYFSAQGPDIGKTIESTIQQLTNQPLGPKITLAPWLYYQAVAKPTDKITKETFIELGEATLLGWIAYSIYDDILDTGEQRKALPAANLAQRRMLELFWTKQSLSGEWVKVLQSILEAIEQANAWEDQHWRITTDMKRQPITDWQLPAVQNDALLANRSLGHALGPLVILKQLKYRHDSTAVQRTIQFFTHYLAARQLSDDAHDWQEDLRHDQLNSASIRLLAHYQAQHNKPVQLEDALPQLTTLFWETIMPTVCQTIEHQLDLAQQTLAENTAIINPTPLHKLIEQEREIVKNTRQQRQQAQEFIATYQ